MTVRRALTSLHVARLMVAVLLLCLFVMAVRPIADPDLWWHLRTGQHIWETGSIPRHDIFSHTLHGQPWITHEWLTEVLLYAVCTMAGQEGLILSFATIITATFALLYLQCSGRPYLASLVVILAAITSAVTWGVRPQMFSLLLSSAFLYILHLYRHGRRSLVWLLPPLMVLWANLHGSFYLGLVFPAVYVIGALIDNALMEGKGLALTWRDVRLLLIVTLVTAAAPVINPNGVQLLIYPFGTLGSPAMQQYIMEWFSPDFHLVQFQPLALFILLLLVSLALSRRAPSPVEFLFMVGFGYAALRSARHIPLFVLATTPILSSQLLHLWRRWGKPERFGTHERHIKRRHLVVNWLLLGVLLLGGSALVGNTLAGNEAAQRLTFPVAAVDSLAGSRDIGNMYNLYQWGGYLIWRLYPDHKVFIDGRADVYGDEFIDEYLQVYQLRKTWQEPLDKYDVDMVFVDEGSSLSTVLGGSVDWIRVYADEQAEIFVREGDS